MYQSCLRALRSGTQVRLFSVAATSTAGKPTSAVSERSVIFRDYEIKVSRLGNGLKVASVDDCKDVSYISAVYQAGVRLETGANRGITQRIRQCLGVSTPNLIPGEVATFLQELGAGFSCTVTREHVHCNLEVIRLLEGAGIELLGEMAIPSFINYEVADSRIFRDDEYEAALTDTDLRLSDLIHSAAYGDSGLGNPLLVPNSKSVSYAASDLTSHTDKYFTAKTGGLFGVGIDHSELLEYAADHFPVGSGNPVQYDVNPFLGGERRLFLEGDSVSCAFVAEGASLENTKGQAVQRVLAMLLDSKLDRLEDTTAVASAIRSAVSDPGHATIDTISQAYSDSGFYGFSFSCRSSDASKAANSALKAVATLAKSVSPTDLDRAKMQAGLEAVVAEDIHSMELLQDMATQLLSGVQYTSPRDMVELINAVTAVEVQEAAKRLVSLNIATAAVGALQDTPTLADLKKQKLIG